MTETRPKREPLFGFGTIYGADGEHATPYLTRIWLGRLRLHIFHRGDADPDCHDHPWDFWTFPLTSYVEEVVERRSSLCMDTLGLGPYRIVQNVVPAWRLSHRPAEHCHRVLGPYAGPYGQGDRYPRVGTGRIVTIVWRGRGGRRWGFLKHRDGNWCWVHWRDYVFGGGKHAPCEPTDRANERNQHHG